MGLLLSGTHFPNPVNFVILFIQKKLCLSWTFRISGTFDKWDNILVPCQLKIITYSDVFQYAQSCGRFARVICKQNKIKIKILTGEFVFVLFFYAKIYPWDVPYQMKITRITFKTWRSTHNNTALDFSHSHTWNMHAQGRCQLPMQMKIWYLILIRVNFIPLKYLKVFETR